MPIPFTCPHCGVETTVAEQYAGQTGPCGSCGQPVSIPPLAGTPKPSARSKSAVPLVALILGVGLVAVLLCGGVFIAFLLLPAVQAARETARRSQTAQNLEQLALALHSYHDSTTAQCSTNLKKIALAMHNYHDTYMCFPPAVITDEQDTPRYSWRVAILPFLQKAALYDQWDPEEAWDGPNNARVGQAGIPEYRCPGDLGDDPTETNYVMITGEEAVGNLPNGATRIANVRDGTAYTIMIVEVVDSGISWSEPRDLSLDQLPLEINAPGGISSRHPGGANVGFCDGTVHFLSEDMAADQLRALITTSGGEKPPDV
jgi:prepilin-type processing-associated H-X9-DG protein